MTASSRNNRLLLATALLVFVIALWKFGRVNGPALPVGPEAKPAAASATPAALGSTAAPSSAEAKKLTAAEQWREPERRDGVDASNIYKDAFVLFDALTDAEKKMLRSPKDEVDADAAAALFQKIQPILAKLREAMKADFCDWGVAPISFETPLNYLQSAQDLGKLALWSAAYRLHDDPANAIEDLQTRARLGHHLSDVLIGGLVSAGFESSATRLLRENLGGFDPANRAAVVEFIAGSTLDADLSRALVSETELAQNMMTSLLGKTQQERVQIFASMGEVAKTASNLNPQEQRLLEMFESPEHAAAELTFLQTKERQFASALTLPEAEFQAWWKATAAEMENGHPLAQTMMPSFESVQRAAQQRRVERTLFLAGIDVLQNGPGQLANYRDPATGAPLRYVATPGGFELRGTYEAKGKPVTLAFPRRE